jgi:hypothetical protein
MQMNSMAIVFQLVSRCYQHSDDSVKKKTLILAADYTLKALRDYLGKARYAHHLTPCSMTGFLRLWLSHSKA